MQRLTDSMGATPTLQALRYLIVALRADPATADLAAEVQAARAALVTAADAADLALVERMVATGKVRYADADLDDAVMALSREVLARVAGKREDPRYAGLFPTAPSTLLTPIGGEKQRTGVKALLLTLRGDPVYADFAEYGDAIEAALTALEAAESARADEQVEVEVANRDERMKRAAAQAVYNKLYPRLQLMFDRPARVEAFFMPLS